MEWVETIVRSVVTKHPLLTCQRMVYQWSGLQNPYRNHLAYTLHTSNACWWLLSFFLDHRQNLIRPHCKLLQSDWPTWVSRKLRGSVRTIDLRIDTDKQVGNSSRNLTNHRLDACWRTHFLQLVRFNYSFGLSLQRFWKPQNYSRNNECFASLFFYKVDI